MVSCCIWHLGSKKRPPPCFFTVFLPCFCSLVFLVRFFCFLNWPSSWVGPQGAQAPQPAKWAPSPVPGNGAYRYARGTWQAAQLAKMDGLQMGGETGTPMGSRFEVLGSSFYARTGQRAPGWRSPWAQPKNSHPAVFLPFFCRVFGFVFFCCFLFFGSY